MDKETFKNKIDGCINDFTNLVYDAKAFRSAIMDVMLELVSPPQSEAWISVKDRLPEILQQVVMVIYEGKEYVAEDIGFRSPDHDNNITWQSNLYIQNVPEWKVTHWMPLLKAPKI